MVQTPAVDERERSPREEVVIQIIGLAALTLAAVIAPMIERAMSDPDIAFRIRWHARDLQHRWQMKVHEANITLESAIGLWQIEESLRRKWKEKATS